MQIAFLQFLSRETITVVVIFGSNWKELIFIVIEGRLEIGASIEPHNFKYLNHCSSLQLFTFVQEFYILNYFLNLYVFNIIYKFQFNFNKKIYLFLIFEY